MTSADFRLFAHWVADLTKNRHRPLFVQKKGLSVVVYEHANDRYPHATEVATMPLGTDLEAAKERVYVVVGVPGAEMKGD